MDDTTSVVQPALPLDRLLSDPIGALAQARSTGPVCHNEMGPVVVGYEAVREVLTDRRYEDRITTVLALQGVTSGPFHDWMARSPLDHDGEEHRRWRALMSRTFTPRRVERLRPALVAMTERLVDGFVERGECEVMTELADVLPSWGLGELIGVPEEDRDRFCDLANTIGLGFNAIMLPLHIHEVDAALTELLAYATTLVDARRREPADDLVSRLAATIDDPAAADGGPPWSTDDIASFVAGLVFAGHETTRNQIGLLVWVLSAHPEVWDAVASGAVSSAAVVEEVLRLRSTATSVVRVATEDDTRHGVPVRAGEPVLVSLWGADHDPSAFPEPEVFDPTRSAGAGHVAFGHGPHHCLGAALARAELQIVLDVLARRVTCPVLVDGGQWRPPVGITGPDRLAVTFAAR
ncbi:MAG: cytochrome P450 [Acidimicrobiales bacterium]|nr:cytochrome P450 [Acidimicrobiales bacterium]